MGRAEAADFESYRIAPKHLPARIVIVAYLGVTLYGTGSRIDWPRVHLPIDLRDESRAVARIRFESVVDGAEPAKAGDCATMIVTFKRPYLHTEVARPRQRVEAISHELTKAVTSTPMVPSSGRSRGARAGSEHRASRGPTCVVARHLNQNTNEE